MKLCGCKEKCFIEGKDWGEFGGVICNYYGEINRYSGYPVKYIYEEVCVSICLSSGQDVEPYINEKQYNEAYKKYSREEKLKRICGSNDL